MRWASAADEPDGLFPALDLFAGEHGTGRMSQLEFLPVLARSVLNHVPNSPWGFRWTINAYRGCSHACTYCLIGDTPVLMADGRTRPIADVRPGDRVYGTVRRGAYRRYAVTEVLAHWRTVKAAYLVRLNDGTQLIASGDHRFLTERGWKHVADTPDAGQRPHLTGNNALLGFGQTAVPYPHSAEYRCGYLTGMIRGDAHLGAYSHNRPGRRNGDVYRFRLALADPEPLDRSRTFLAQFTVPTRKFAFSARTSTRRPVSAIRNSGRHAFDTISELISWPNCPSDAWRAGFLAGIFDAEGSHSGGVLRISNSDPEILSWTMACAGHFGFTAVLEPAKANGVRCVRIRGGLSERMRFLVMTDPATTRKRRIDGMAIKNTTDLGVAEVRALGINLPMYDVTTGTGDFIANGVVSHNCFARPTHEYLGMNAGEDFDRKIVVKVNAVDVLRRELSAPGWAREPVAMGTNTDPYQRAEAKFRLTRGIVGALAAADTPFSVLTKSPLVTRDLDLLAPAAQRLDVSVTFSIATVDERAWKAAEPGTPHPMRRIEAMRAMVEAGIRTGAIMAPILPGLSDSRAQLAATKAAIRSTGADVLHAHPVYLRGATREHFMAWLHEFDPDLYERYVRGISEAGDVSEEYRTWLRHALADA